MQVGECYLCVLPNVRAAASSGRRHPENLVFTVLIACHHCNQEYQAFQQKSFLRLMKHSVCIDG